MFLSCTALLASFTVPHELGSGPASLLWILPLIAAVAIVWKALKLHVITPARYIREVAVLFGTMLVCYAAIAVALYIVGRLILG